MSKTYHVDTIKLYTMYIFSVAIKKNNCKKKQKNNNFFRGANFCKKSIFHLFFVFKKVDFPVKGKIF